MNKIGANDGLDRKPILNDRIPREHVEFLTSLPNVLVLPSAIFAPAGLCPGVAVNAHNDDDLTWIGEPFPGRTDPFGVRVVHGHTPSGKPSLNINRIGIDTGAFATSVLTPARLDASGNLAFLNTTMKQATAMQPQVRTTFSGTPPTKLSELAFKDE